MSDLGFLRMFLWRFLVLRESVYRSRPEEQPERWKRGERWGEGNFMMKGLLGGFFAMCFAEGGIVGDVLVRIFFQLRIVEVSIDKMETVLGAAVAWFFGGWVGMNFFFFGGGGQGCVHSFLAWFSQLFLLFKFIVVSLSSSCSPTVFFFWFFSGWWRLFIFCCFCWFCCFCCVCCSFVCSCFFCCWFSSCSWCCFWCCSFGWMFLFPSDLGSSLFQTALMVPRFKGRFRDWASGFVLCVAVVVVVICGRWILLRTESG